ncbi:DUF6873 family GME fold protein [Inediibacterium massiliense]|uniref:DUF6873 family GME fold protein n=1 Tax=Inediibacterium massiliense TaxID=1658111 RepID=UPI0006B5BCE2|nr:hypothetical protein [Inediibacterium massiliense]
MKKKYLETPFLPKKNVHTVIVDGRISKTIEKNLKDLKIQILKTPHCKELYDAISYHPDILLHPVTGKDVVIAPNVYKKMAPIFHSLGICTYKGDTILKRNYPENIAYNIGRVGKFAIHNFKYTDPLTFKLLQDNEIECIHVKQGYAKCSICVVNEKAIITSDKGIAKQVEKYGIDVLWIHSGYIDLFDLNYGFIGGSCGFVEYNSLAFSGNFKNHPDEKRIFKFLNDYEVKPIFLTEQDPVDIGSIIPILEME